MAGQPPELGPVSSPGSIGRRARLRCAGVPSYGDLGSIAGGTAVFMQR